MMKKIKKVVSLALASIMTLSMCAVSALSAGAVDETDYSTLPVTKNLVVNNEKTVVPDATFRFEMDPVAAADLKDSSGNALKDANGNTLKEGPALNENTIDISFNADSTAKGVVDEWIMSGTNSFDLKKFKDNKDFESTGVYRYVVTETGSVITNNDGTKKVDKISYIDYDASTYYVDLYVVQDESSNYYIDKYVLTKKNDPAKPNNVEFKNTYNCADLNIYKTVKGTEYQQGEYYNFSILIPVGGTTIDLKENSYFLAKIIGANGSAVTNDTDRNIGDDGYIKIYVRGDKITADMDQFGNSFKLKNGEHLQILDVPTTMIYKVKEDAATAKAEEYKVYYKYTETGSISTATRDNTITEFTTSDDFMTDCSVQGTINSTANSVAFQNERIINPPTGISFDVLPYALIVLVAACGGVLLIIKKKRNAQ